MAISVSSAGFDDSGWVTLARERGKRGLYGTFFTVDDASEMIACDILLHGGIFLICRMSHYQMEMGWKWCDRFQTELKGTNDAQRTPS
jgi:hypothetical protein